MNLSNLLKTTKGSAKRVGRGIGSGKGGHTSGRGTKGQKARGKVALTFEGTKVKKSLLKRLPFLRGKGKFKPWGTKFVPVKLSMLTDWPTKTAVTLDNLIKQGLVDKSEKRVKIVGSEKLKQALTVKVSVTAGAKKSIEAAGGIIEDKV